FLSGVSKEMGLTDALKVAFPQDWGLILSCVFYLLDTDTAPLSRVTYWSKDNDNPYGKAISSEIVSDMLARINENQLFSFFREWRDRFTKNEFYMSHTMSVTSYDNRNDTIRFNDLPLVSIVPKTGLSTIYANKTGIPVTYGMWNRAPVDNLDIGRRVREKSWLDLDKLTQVLDHEFCNDLNIDGLFNNGTRFIVRAPPEFYFARDAIIRVKDRIMAMDNLKVIDGEQLFVMSFLNYWKGRRCYTHIYFSTEEAEAEFSYFLGLIEDCHNELDSNVRVREHESFYRKYFNVTETNYGKIVVENGEAIMSYNDVAGFFVLISNTVKSPVAALNLYHQKDMVEKEFENLRNERDRVDLKLYSDTAYRGRLFLQFICLILKARILNAIGSNTLLKGMNVQDLLQEMKAVKKVSIPGFDTPFYTKVNNIQAEIMKTFAMDPLELTSVSRRNAT
ncbi:MAG: hypothetical protein J6V08_03645, partial [Candidatus Methanomethylophilaceae archaeon]|nr:hypothetical protein [Candidatus Methanomethylophilaceae archaeon]